MLPDRACSGAPPGRRPQPSGALQQARASRCRCGGRVTLRLRRPGRKPLVLGTRRFASSRTEHRLRPRDGAARGPARARARHAPTARRAARRARRCTITARRRDHDAGASGAGPCGCPERGAARSLRRFFADPHAQLPFVVLHGAADDPSARGRARIEDRRETHELPARPGPAAGPAARRGSCRARRLRRVRRPRGDRRRRRGEGRGGAHPPRAVPARERPRHPGQPGRPAHADARSTSPRRGRRCRSAASTRRRRSGASRPSSARSSATRPRSSRPACASTASTCPTRARASGRRRGAAPRDRRRAAAGRREPEEQAAMKACEDKLPEGRAAAAAASGFAARRPAASR